MLDPVTAVKNCLNKFFNFKGRARRSEYWWFVLFTIIVSSVFSSLSLFLPMLSVVGMVIGLILLIPMLAALTRRLHDRGHSGWWVFLYGLSLVLAYGAVMYILYPYLGQLQGEGSYGELAKIIADAVQDNQGAATVYLFSCLAALLFFIITLVFSVMDSKWGENKYGPSPKYQ